MSHIAGAACAYGLHLWKKVKTGKFYDHYECRRPGCPATRLEEK